MNDLPPHRHGGAGTSDDADRPARDRTRTLRRFALAAVVLLVVGFAAGTLFGRVDPQRAARLVVAEFTVTEAGSGGVPGPDPAFPTTGPQRGEPVCGRLEAPLAPAVQVATVASGVVIVQHRVDISGEEAAFLDHLATRDRIAVAPHEALGEGEPAVVATSWRHRMALDRVDRDLLDAFVTGHADRAPAVTACP